MVRNILLLLLLLLTDLNGDAAAKNKLPKLVFGDMGFCCHNVFVYAMAITDDNRRLVKNDTLGLFCYDADEYSENQQKEMHEYDWQKMMEWKFLTLKDSGKYDIPKGRFDESHTGIGINDSELFIHPARFSYIKILQYCPYPVFHSVDSIGKSWEWDLDIGGPYWAIDSLYPLRDTSATFHTKYTFSDTATAHTEFGNLFCYKIKAINTSKFGSSTAIYWLNKQYGMVSFSVQTINKLNIKFVLIKKGSDEVLMKAGTTFMNWKRRQRKNFFENKMKLY